MDITFIDDNEPDRLVPTLEAYIAVSENCNSAHVLKYTGHENDFFHSLDKDLFDQGLLPPDSPDAAVYLCSDFHATNLSRDWETGHVDNWDIACKWVRVW